MSTDVNSPIVLEHSYENSMAVEQRDYRKPRNKVT